MSFFVPFRAKLSHRGQFYLRALFMAQGLIGTVACTSGSVSSDSSSDGSGGWRSDPQGICGRRAPLPEWQCRHRYECRGVDLYVMSNPFGENCSCAMVFERTCTRGCENDACIDAENIGGAGGMGGGGGVAGAVRP